MFFDTMLLNILDNANSVNAARDKKDKYYNYIFYGCLWTYTEVFKELGRRLDVEEQEENGFIFIKQIILDGIEIFENGIANEDNVNKFLYWED